MFELILEEHPEGGVKASLVGIDQPGYGRTEQEACEGLRRVINNACAHHRHWLDKQVERIHREREASLRAFKEGADV